MKKVIYFTAGPVPTSGEISAIAALNTRAGKPLDVAVRDGSNPSIGDDYGDGRLEDCDYVAGTVPTAYNGETVLPAGIGIANGAAMNVRNSAASKTVAGTAVVAAEVLTSVDLPATAALLTTAQALVVPVTGTYATTATVTIAGGVVTAIALS